MTFHSLYFCHDRSKLRAPCSAVHQVVHVKVYCAAFKQAASASVVPIWVPNRYCIEISSSYQLEGEAPDPSQSKRITTMCQKRHTYYPNMRPFDNKIMREQGPVVPGLSPTELNTKDYYIDPLY